ncbi:hypothetical protein [Maritimibacter sp. DP1N21-5]|uniref:hypothetical protein n=1 Tax=Maritimibacter sp. DP1N21-5 TaxID=2836867 RepID=UPI001C43CD55|nr:hypothetical protein [Maritimibacter sp. DP1N21-5]MBV7407727.1 hypothetical protein [Maritimibacter sp. DP1N21-5]
MRARLTLTLLAALAAGSAIAQERDRSALEAPFDIWDAHLGEPVTIIPPIDVNELACGTNGGPYSLPLADPAEFMTCPPEASGLREVHFSYDDELDYVARAMESEYDVLQDGTTVFSHKVMVSVLVSEDGIIEGIRILTDPRIPARERRRAVTLMRNLEARYGDWSLMCEDLPLAESEMMIGNVFTKRVCTGTSPDGEATLRLDARYLRKAGQEAVNRETRELNSTYFESFSRLEMVRLPYEPSPPPVRDVR